MLRNVIKEGFLTDPIGEIFTPFGDNVVANESVVDLFDSSDDGEHGGVDLFFSE